MARKHNHAQDAIRSQLAYLLTGTVSNDTLDGTRDWHDELQSTRELGRASLPDRIFRERLLHRTHADFVSAVSRAVPRVAAGESQALNPMDPPEAHMFLCNNLFISKGVDGINLYPHLGGDEAAYVAVGKDVQGTKALNMLDLEGLCLIGTAVVDWRGTRWVAQSIVPGLFRHHGDIEEERAIADAQTGEAEDKEETTSKKVSEETAVIYGGLDGPEIIRTNAKMHEMFEQIAGTLRLAKHSVEDAKGKKHELWASVECKGLRGADGRLYALDLARLQPVDIEWLETDYSGKAVNDDAGIAEYPHKMTLLRPELLELFWEHSFRNWANEEIIKQEEASKSAESEKEGEEKSAEAVAAAAEARRLDPADFKLTFNPDAFVEVKITDEKSDAEEEVRTRVLTSDESDPLWPPCATLPSTSALSLCPAWSPTLQLASCRPWTASRSPGICTRAASMSATSATLHSFASPLKVTVWIRRSSKRRTPARQHSSRACAASACRR